MPTGRPDGGETDGHDGGGQVGQRRQRDPGHQIGVRPDRAVHPDHPFAGTARCGRAGWRAPSPPASAGRPPRRRSPPSAHATARVSRWRTPSPGSAGWRTAPCAPADGRRPRVTTPPSRPSCRTNVWPWWTTGSDTGTADTAGPRPAARQRAGHRPSVRRLPAARPPPPASTSPTSAPTGIRRIVEPDRQPQIAQCLAARRRQLQPPPGGRMARRAREHLQREFEVGDVARQRADDGQIGRGQRARRRRQVAAPATRRPRSACARTRRTSSTGSGSSRRCRCPARAPSGRSRPRPRRRPTTRRWCASCPTGCCVVPKIALYVCQSPARVGVLVLPKITAPAPRSRRTASASRSGTWSQAAQPAGGAHARGLVGVLDRHRHAVQRADVVAAGQRRVGGVGGARAPVGVERDDGVERAVERFDAGQVMIQQLAARQVATADGLGQRMCGLQCDVRHANALSFKQRVQTPRTRSDAERLRDSAVERN